MQNQHEWLIIAPPVLVPTQIPVGGLVFSAMTAGANRKTYLYDASIEFFQFILNTPIPPTSQNHRLLTHQGRANRAVSYFQSNRYFSPQTHRTHINNLHKFLTQWSAQFNGWQLGLTDVLFTGIPPHNPEQFADYILHGGETPFSAYIQKQLLPTIQSFNLKNTGLSLTYISQIYFTIELGVHLQNLNIQPVLGGALVNVIEQKTGRPFLFNGLFKKSEFLISDRRNRDTTKMNFPLKWPDTVMPLKNYFTPVPIIPFPLSKGCYWNRCLFCPDAGREFRYYDTGEMIKFLSGALERNQLNEVIFNICDSTVPISRLNKMLPFFREVNSEFYGFFRFEKVLLKSGYLAQLHQSGARLLQFGLESGSHRLLELFQKGINLAEAQSILTKSMEAGLKNYVYLLFGLPTETADDREQTIKLVQQNHQAIHFLNISLFNLPTGCEISRNPARFKIDLTNEEKYQQPLQLYLPFTSRDGAVRAVARRFIQNRLKKDPLVRPILLNTPDRLRIDHAVFF